MNLSSIGESDQPSVNLGRNMRLPRCLALLAAASALRPVPNTARRRRVVCRAADWTQSEDWALTDGAKRFTRSSRTGDERLFYEDLAASLGPAAGARPATELRARLEALGCTAPPPPRVLDAWREESAGERFSGTLDGDVTEVATARVSFLGAEETRYVETTGGEIILLGTPADAPAAPVESSLPPRLSLTAPTLPRWAPLAALPLALLLLAARSLAPPDGAAGTYLYESTTVVTQRAFDDEGDTVVRVQRRRATRSSEAPQTRVQTDTVVRRTARGDDGTLVKTTTRDRAVNPTFDAEPRPATSAEMSALLRPKGALPPATGTPSSAATPTPDVDNPP